MKTITVTHENYQCDYCNATHPNPNFISHCLLCDKEICTSCRGVRQTSRSTIYLCLSCYNRTEESNGRIVLNV